MFLRQSKANGLITFARQLEFSQGSSREPEPEQEKSQAMSEPLQQRNSRARVSLTCEVRQGTRPWKQTRLEDISQKGFRIAWLPNCRPELPLRIRIPGLQLLSAHIRWQDNGAVGCEFTEPLHVAVLEHLVRCAQTA